MEKHETRRRNFAALIEREGSQEALAEKLDVSEGYVSQLKTGASKISEKTARKYEQILGLPREWMDIDASALASATDPELAARLIQRLLEMDAEERQYWVNVLLTAPRRR